MKNACLRAGAGRLLGGLALATLANAAAHAADLPRRSAPLYANPVYAPVSAFSWSGFYAGGTVGYDFGRFRDSAFYGSTSGFTLGATAGYNYQSGNLVVGLEGDANWTNLNDNHTFGGGLASKASSNSLVTVRGRLGYAVDRALIYGTVGYAGASLKAQLFDPTIPAVFNASNWHNGYALGAGIEYAFTPSVSVKAEYIYATVGSNSAFAGADATRIGLHENIVRTGLNYHF